jgi:cell division septation protein DedD
MMGSGNAKNFELKLGRTGLVIVIVGMAALLCSTFLFGVAVGKNIDTYPEKIALLPQKLLALVWLPAKIKIAQTEAGNKAAQNQPKAQEEPDLTFFNTLTGKKGMAKEKPIPDKKPVIEAPPAVQPLSPQPKSKSDTTAAAITPGSEVKKQQAEKKTSGTDGDEIEAKIKEAEPAAVAQSGKFSVQVASLKEKISAAQLSKKLSTLGYKPRIVENNIPGKGKWFRVVVEGFSSKVNAQTAAEKISGKIGVHGVVKRIETTVKSN